MIKFFLISMAFLFSVTSVAQQQLRNNVSNESISISGNAITQFQRNEITGNPYLFDDWKSAVVILSGDNSNACLVNYNVLKERMEFTDMSKSDVVKSLPLDNSIVINIDNRKFQYLKSNNPETVPSNYFEVIHEFDSNHRLLKLHSKTLDESLVSVKSGYSTTNLKQQPSIQSYSALFMANGENFTLIENHKRRIVKSLDESKKDELKSYIKNQDIDFDDDLEGLIKVLEYYISLN